MKRLPLILLAIAVLCIATQPLAAQLRAAAAAVTVEADDSMIIGGSILGRYPAGQEGELRASALLVQDGRGNTLAIVSCDMLMMSRDLLDIAAQRIAQATSIPTANILLHATHTHAAPSTCRVHGYDRDEVFSRRMVDAIVAAATHAHRQLAPATLHFVMGQENTIGQNSRLLLADGTISWTGRRDDAIRPTGPFDPDLPILAARHPNGSPIAILYGHSTHTIGTLAPNVRSPGFHGLAAQQLEHELGGVGLYIQGASGSTHNWTVKPVDALARLKDTIRQGLAQAKPLPVDRVAALKRPFEVRVRHFDEAAQEAAVTSYCRKRIGGDRAEQFIEVFRTMRAELAPRQGESRTTWLQVMSIGDLAIVAVPAEFFTKLGLDIKQRSPFPHTIIAELANDWIGYVGDREAYDLGGYQLWMGLHSWVEPATGERIVEQTLAMLHELHAQNHSRTSR